ncbi:major facilitator superfamily domain-containing protein [Truncatella angustata]|uniref:Major facilitator superfamily domain-containing protein n=1 Tax=Truncatella angustata TaxID=152316 RepID=A0A9P8RHT0_9PEZI|nr:major facilitator superfamily domain-containing protein [Truncatella angustata]KAH6638613.1 major facilitator superfamily domain-containing protein [Truncatella angustata]
MPAISAPSNSDVESSEKQSSAADSTGNDDAGPTETLPDAGTDTAHASNPSVKPSEDHDTVRTIRGFKWFLVYSSLLSTVLFYALEATVVANIQPSIIETFGEEEKLPWIGIGVFLGSLAILPVGRAYAVFNLKWLFISACILFQAGSALGGAAPNMDAFIIGRVLQGVGAAGCYSGAITFISTLTSQHERPLYLSGIVAIWSVGSVVGPVIGGAFAQSNATWRWGFYINLCVGALTAPGLIFFLPNIDPAPKLSHKEKLLTQDWVAIVIFLAGSACFSMALTFGGIVYPFNSGSEIALWTLSGVLLIAFISVSIFHPLVATQNRLYPIHLVKRTELDILQFAILVNAGAMVTTLYYVPLIFQFTRGDGPLIAGVRLLPFLGGMISFSVLNGALMPRLGYYMPWYVLGTALILIGSSLMSTLSPSTSEARLYGYTVLIGGGCGSFFTAGFSVVQALVPVAELSNAISFMALGQTMGQIVILSLGGTLFQNIGSRGIKQIIPGISTQDAIHLTTGIHSSQFQSLGPELQAQVIAQVTLSIRNVFIVMVSTSALALIMSLSLSRRKIYGTQTK